MIDCGSGRLYWLARAAPAASQATAAAIDRNPFLIMLPSPGCDRSARGGGEISSTRRMEAALERARQVQALLVVHVTADFQFPPVRAQRDPAAVFVRHHLRPVAIERAPEQGSPVRPLDLHRVAVDLDQLVVRRVALHVAKRDEQHEHLEPGERQDQPRPESRKGDGDADRDDEDQCESDQPAGGAERVVAPDDPPESGLVRHVAAFGSCDHLWASSQPPPRAAGMYHRAWGQATNYPLKRTLTRRF